jgi:hypothetical protein
MARAEHEVPQCPQCGRFTGEGYGEPGDADYSPGFWDSALHAADENGRCREAAEQEEYAVAFCDRSCADRFHGRTISAQAEAMAQRCLANGNEGAARFHSRMAAAHRRFGR